MTTMNPFLVQSTLPYLAPHFDQIANHHYRPAFDEGMQQKRAKLLPSRLTRKCLISTILFWHWNKAEITYPRYQRLFCDDCGAYQ
ncbi:dipeptidyl carboxypeptidase II [Escherichia coli ECA-727]|nr:dipeptidyl carboxypeptidase II [Escherichia coli ECA-727]